VWIAFALCATLTFGMLGGAGVSTTSAARNPNKGTTLQRTIRGDGDRTLKFGPGLPRVTRTLGWKDTGKGQPLVAFKHLSDVHVLDEESPARVEWLDGCSTPFSAAYRVHEAFSTQIGNAMLKRLARLKKGPVTGARFRFAVSTGDNVDNNQENETEWFIRLLNGQSVDPNSGGGGYRGYTKDQFSGALPASILEKAQKPFDSIGTKLPWYAVLGNHDGLVQGNAPRNDGFNDIAVGDAKVFADVEAEQDCPDDPNDFEKMQDLLQQAILGSDVQQVPADPKRRLLTHKQLVDEYLASPGRPAGHGLARAPNDPMHGSKGGYYWFKMSKRVRGISLDTISYDGVANGHIPDPQFKWLGRQLRKWSPYRWVEGKRVPTRSRTNKLIVIFSHHSSATLNNPGTNEDGQPYHCFRRTDTPECEDAAGLKQLLHRYPNVVLWVNGHEHNNAIRAFPWAGKDHPERGFFEINTASHIDWPQQSRLIEMAWKPHQGKKDTLFVYTTTVDHGAPLRPNASKQGRVQYLASLGRVEGYVDACLRNGQANCEAAGRTKDQNTKLVLKAPFDLGDP
jgi:metallophosphoesterase (TIGR03767 family)